MRMPGLTPQSSPASKTAHHQPTPRHYVAGRTPYPNVELTDSLRLSQDNSSQAPGVLYRPSSHRRAYSLYRDTYVDYCQRQTHPGSELPHPIPTSAPEEPVPASHSPRPPFPHGTPALPLRLHSLRMKQAHRTGLSPQRYSRLAR